MSKISPERSLMLILVFGVFTLGLLTIILPGSDHLENCQKPDPFLTFYQPIGDDYGLFFTRWMQPDNETVPITTSPPITSLLSLFTNNNYISTSRTRAISNLLPAWLQFISHDLFRIYGNASEPLTYINRTNHTIDQHDRRQQINYATPRIDGSHLYGTTPEMAMSIRMNDGTGRLRVDTSTFPALNDRDFMPYDGNVFFSVDDRVLEGNAVIASLYQLFIREHNYWAVRLKTEDPTYNENYLYEMAKHIIIGELQAVTYNEALPALLGREMLPYCYAGTQHPTRVYNEWAVGVAPTFDTLVDTTLSLRDPSNNFYLPPTTPWPITATSLWHTGITSILLGAAWQPAQHKDIFLNGDMSQALERARDHQSPTYQALYKHTLGHTPRSCQNFILNEMLCDVLDSLYPDGQYMDLVVALLAEKPYGDSVYGHLGTSLMVHQFDTIKNRDPYFYTSNNAIQNQRAEILHTRLSKIIRRNVASSSFFKNNVFIAH
jgi:hypothetical protein